MVTSNVGSEILTLQQTRKVYWFDTAGLALWEHWGNAWCLHRNHHWLNVGPLSMTLDQHESSPRKRRNLTNVYLMLAQRRRRWANIKYTLVQDLMFVEEISAWCSSWSTASSELWWQVATTYAHFDLYHQYIITLHDWHSQSVTLFNNTFQMRCYTCEKKHVFIVYYFIIGPNWGQSVAIVNVALSHILDDRELTFPFSVPMSFPRHTNKLIGVKTEIAPLLIEGTMVNCWSMPV